MPAQPLSSRLSLAQAVVSANSRSKAVSIGLENGPSGEEEGWGGGQPRVRVMGREIRALRRYGWAGEGMVEGGELKQEDGPKGEIEDLWDVTGEVSQETAASQSTVKGQSDEIEPALWGLDLEALRSSEKDLFGARKNPDATGLPIYTPQSARDYLLKSFNTPPSTTNSQPAKKKSAAAVAKEREDNLAMLLEALDLLMKSWAQVLSTAELDRRAWTWYVHVRPEVANGVAGWGGKGEVKLAEILNLRRKG
jgi:hypothetical protein